MNCLAPVATFFPLELGDAPADHHTLALVQGFMTAYSHSTFEVIDVAAIGLSQATRSSTTERHPGQPPRALDVDALARQIN